MKRIGLIVNTEKPHATEAMEKVLQLAKERALDVFVDSLSPAGNNNAPRCPIAHFSHKGVEAIVVLGGDGTMLDAVRAQGPQQLPMVGLNIGSLGYLTSVEESQFGDALTLLKEGRYTISWRSALSAEIRRHGRGQHFHLLPDALNEIVVSRGESGSAVELEIFVDGRWISGFLCDGIIVATPTGSTAYSLSAGGPILLPDADCLVVNLICPHTLTSRPLVIRETATISVRVAKAEAPLIVSADGRDNEPIQRGDEVSIRTSTKRVPVIALEGWHPCDVMRKKLGWGILLEDRKEHSRE